MKPRKKGGRKALARGAPRLLGLHHGWQGREYGRHYAALETELGAFTRQLLRLEAGRVSAAWVNLVAATRALATARRERERGQGRRPGPRDVERLAKRQGLADASYAAALDKLRTLAQANGHGRTPSVGELVAASRERPG